MPEQSGRLSPFSLGCQTPRSQAGPSQLRAFVEWAEGSGRCRPRGYLWALKYYFRFANQEGMAALAGELRQARIHRIKGIRARLYLGAGVGSAQALAIWDPAGLRAHLQAPVIRWEDGPD